MIISNRTNSEYQCSRSEETEGTISKTIRLQSIYMFDLSWTCQIVLGSESNCMVLSWVSIGKSFSEKFIETSVSLEMCVGAACVEKIESLETQCERVKI